MNDHLINLTPGDEVAPDPGPPLAIGLVNNMPDSALVATEAQFRSLLTAAAGARTIEMKLIALPEIPRSAAARDYLENRYEGPAAISAGRLDGLIVTGTEPRFPKLQSEPYWGAVEALVEIAQHNTVSTIWSCLAAHAAVLCLDGIERRRFPTKLFGVYRYPPSAVHPLVAGLGEDRFVPHSRHNDAPEELLVAAGYQVLARHGKLGADLFVKERRSLFVFLQGHPEYDSSALMREYRRDIGRFLSGERADYPGMPDGYLDVATARRFADFRAHAIASRGAGAAPAIPGTEAGWMPDVFWHERAVGLYRNWLSLIEQRSRPTDSSRSGMPAQARGLATISVPD